MNNLITPGQHGLRIILLRFQSCESFFATGSFSTFDKAELKPQASAILDTIAASLRREASDVTVFVAGHTDAVGTVNYNLQLGLRRSRAVAVELAGRGIPRTQVYVVSFGKAVPIASNNTDDGRSQNRRV